MAMFSIFLLPKRFSSFNSELEHSVIFSGSHNKATQYPRLKQKKVFILPLLKTASRTSRCHRAGWFPLEEGEGAWQGLAQLQGHW